MTSGRFASKKPSASSLAADRLTSAASVACPITQPTTTPAEIGDRLFGSTSAYGNDDLWVGGLGQDGILAVDNSVVHKDGSIGAKLGWWRNVPGNVVISGRRLDAPAPPLVGRGSDGYGITGFQASGVLFPTEGCWEVTGRVGESALTFVIFVIRSEP